MLLEETAKIVEEIAKIGTYETDLTTGKWKGSPNFIKTFGLEPKEEYSIEEFQEIVHPHDYEIVMAYFGQCLEQQKDFNFEYRCLKSDGNSIYVQSRSKIFYDEDGTPLKIIGIKQDITERKLTEIKLKELAQEIKQTQSVHFSSIIHDLKTPIHQLKGLTHLLRVDEIDRGEAIDFLDKILNYSSNLIYNLLEVSEIENNKLILNLEPIDIIEIVDNVVKSSILYASEKDIRIDIHYHTDACSIIGDVDKLSRAINNVLSNAIKFSHSHSTITVSTANINGSIDIVVKDQGIGIKPKALKFIFDRFSNQRKNGTRGEKTTGMGLFITKKIVEAHKGNILCESEEGVGSTFTIRLKRLKKNLN